MSGAGTDRSAQQSPGPAAPLSAGRVGRAHGLDGSFYVTRPRPRLLSVGTIVSLGDRQTTIERRAGTEQRPIVRVGGVTDRDAADALRGTELLVDGAHAPALEQDEWWAHELEGCTVWAGERELGVVSRLIELPSCEALEVHPPRSDPGAPGAGEPLLVPMVKDAVLRVTPAERRIEVDPDFLGLAAPDAAGPGAGERDPEGRGGR